MPDVIEKDISEESLQPQEVKIDDLSKEELVRLVNDKNLESDNYKTLLDEAKENNKEILTSYNDDMSYMQSLNSNLVKTFRKKEDAIRAIIDGALTLMTIDRDEIAPKRKENN